MDYLLKVSVIWALFLLLFEVSYKDNGRFTANRIYLLLSICLGLLLPLVPLPSGVSLPISTPQHIYTTTQTTYTKAVVPHAKPAAVTAPATEITIPTNHAPHLPDLLLVIRIIYILGVLVLLIKCLVELFKITLLVQRAPTQILYGHKVIATGKVHSPYSFMGRIFLTGTDMYAPEELEYIIRHEAAHSTRKHWVDLWMMQLACILFWFHPLVWRFRYLLQLQHEYEADKIAANNDPYAYGHFLIQQTLFQGVPSIAHSFHFSPIKNRINMLTKKHSFKSDSWKYLLLAPALFCCTFLMAKTATNVGPLSNNETAFKGNIFAWRPTDTLYYDKAKDQNVPVPATEKEKRQIIVSMNGSPVYQNEYLETPAAYGDSEIAYEEYVQKEFTALCKHTADSGVGMHISSLVVNKEGKIVYYDVRYYRPNDELSGKAKFLYPFLKPEPVLNALIEKIVDKGPTWKPATIDGKPVNSFVSFYSSGC